MAEPHAVVAGLLGPVSWETPVSGFCQCPGLSLHTSRTGAKDCRVSIDGAPTIFCFHSSCSAKVEAANLALRRALGGTTHWEIRLPGGAIVRPGDSVAPTGEVIPKEAMVAAAILGGQNPNDRLVEESLRNETMRRAPQIFERFRWTYDQIVARAPVQTGGLDPDDAEDQFQSWLYIWPPSSRVWVGGVYDSGKPEHATHFRPVSDWFQIGTPMGNYTCGASFKGGSYARSNANVNGHRFLVVESDILSKDQIGAIFAYLNNRLNMRLHAIVDTAGKSLHGWFSQPTTPQIERHLKIGLTALGCDPKLFTYSQPVRVPGAIRDGRMQKLLWLKRKHGDS